MSVVKQFKEGCSEGRAAAKAFLAESGFNRLIRQAVREAFVKREALAALGFHGTGFTMEFSVGPVSIAIEVDPAPTFPLEEVLAELVEQNEPE